MSTKRDYYEILGVAKTATEEDIKKAFRRLAMKHHPDRNPGDKAAEESFKECKQAYEILTDAQAAAGAAGGGAGAQGAGGGAGPKEGEEKVVDAEFTEVKDRK